MVRELSFVLCCLCEEIMKLRSRACSRQACSFSTMSPASGLSNDSCAFWANDIWVPKCLGRYFAMMPWWLNFTLKHPFLTSSRQDSNGGSSYRLRHARHCKMKSAKDGTDWTDCPDCSLRPFCPLHWPPLSLPPFDCWHRQGSFQFLELKLL